MSVQLKFNAVVFCLVIVYLTSQVSCGQPIQAQPLKQLRAIYSNEIDWIYELNSSSFQQWYQDALELSNDQKTELRSLKDYWNEGLLEANGDNPDEIMIAEAMKLARAKEVMEGVQNVLGPKFDQLIQLRNRRFLQKDLEIDPSFLTSKILAKEIGLTEAQKAKFKELVSAAADQIAQEKERLKKEIEELDSQRWKRMKRSLTEEQIKKAKGFFGDWLSWESFAESDRFIPDDN